MSIKQLNRDFATTFASAELRYGRKLGRCFKRDIESSMREAERMCLQYDKQEGAPRYADVIAVVSDRRLYSAQSTGVRLSTTNLLGIRPVRGIGWHVAVLRFAEKPGFGWTWSCPLKVDHALDLHWKGLVERDKWKRFMSRLNSVCTEASIFAHAFRHGA